MTAHPKILVSPLNWGIGHATRLVPVIQELLRQGAEVHIGASGHAAAFLREEFPDLPLLDLPGHNVNYPASGSGMAMAMARQFPAMLKSVRQEHDRLHGLIRSHGFRGVISDNRYGLFSEKIPCIFITHQVFIRTPGPMVPLRPFVNSLNRRYINRFTACWIPDLPGEENLSGALSHRHQLPDSFHFIGPLSRFAGIRTNHNSPKDKPSFDVLAILSGPEPQRSLLEDILLKEFAKSDMKSLLVRGKPGSGDLPDYTERTIIHNHLETRAMKDAIGMSNLVIARSGYSTIMDLALLGKKAVLIPTPGQTEQEYLGSYLDARGYFAMMTQDRFNLVKALEKAGEYSGLSLPVNMEALQKRVTEFLARI